MRMEFLVGRLPALRAMVLFILEWSGVMIYGFDGEEINSIVDKNIE